MAIKIHSTLSGTFDVENVAGIITRHMKSENVSLLVDGNKISIHKLTQKGKVQILGFTDYTNLVDPNDVAYPSISEALLHLTSIIKPVQIFAGTADKLISRYLEDVGANTNMAVDGSITPVVYNAVFTTPAILTRFKLYLEDATAFSSNLFGAIPALTNGVFLQIDGEPAGLWKTNEDIALDADNSEELTYMAFVGRHLIAHKQFNPAIELPEGAEVSITIQDDLSGLNRLTFRIEGTRL